MDITKATKNKSTYYHKEKKAKKKVVGYLGRGVAVKVWSNAQWIIDN